MSSWRTAAACLASLCLVAIVVLPAIGQEQPSTWRAGWAARSITPREPLWMSGYASRNRPAEDKQTELWVKCLILEDRDQQLGIVFTLDLVGISGQLAETWTRALATRYGWERKQIAYCTSHTHSGPVVGQNLNALHYRQLNAEHQMAIDHYTSWLTEQLLAAAHQAFQNRVPVALRWGSGKAEFAVNRRNNTEKDVPDLREQRRLKGPVDHDVPVLAVYSPDNQLKVVLFGYACHATTLSGYAWSGDYPGYAQLELERQYPGCQAMFWAGCGADQNPLPRRKVELAEGYGRQLAASVQTVLSGSMSELAPQLRTRWQKIDLPFDQLPTQDEWQRRAKSNNRYEVARAKMWLEHLASGQEVPAHYPYPMGQWVLGDQVEWITLGGEVVVDFAARLKSERQGGRTWVAGYAHDVMAYIPSRRVWIEGGYEGGGAMVYYGQPAIWDVSVEAKIIDASRQWSGPARNGQ